MPRLWEMYSRQDVHDIFSPNTLFNPTWRMHGMIRIPGSENDWVFFVTFGQQQAHHVFDESITEDGVLSWQSQLGLGFDSERIQSLINHTDEDAIHLFLRAENNDPYVYLGRLKYLTHDNERQNPVYFQWQLMDWPQAPEDFLRDNIGITPLRRAPQILNELPAAESNQLIQVDVPLAPPVRVGTTTDDFQTPQKPDWGLNESRNRELGLAGEKLVFAREIKNLIDKGRRDLADQVVHVSVNEGDGAGYDIRSYDPNGQLKYIEVKTTKCSTSQASFFISANEIEFSKEKSDNYFLYRVYDFDDNSNSGKFFIIQGNLYESLELLPAQYKASLRQQDED